MLSSSLGYSFTEVTNTNFQSTTAFHKGEYASVNLLWYPASKVMIGGELMWGKLHNNDGMRISLMPAGCFTGWRASVSGMPGRFRGALRDVTDCGGFAFFRQRAEGHAVQSAA